MKIWSDAAIAAMTDGTAISIGAVKIGCTPPVRVWGGYGQITLAGETYDGIGDRGLIAASAGTIGSAEQNVSLTLSGVEPSVLALWSASEVRRAPCQIWELIWDGSGTVMLDAKIFTAGRIDACTIDEEVGGTATIIAQVETAARGLGQTGQRMRTDADQRLIDANDAGFRAISFAGQKTLYWGGQRPSSASTLGWTPLLSPSGIGLR